MSETRGVVVIAVALIGAAATIVAALVARPDADTSSPPAAVPAASETAVPGTAVSATVVPPAPPAPAQPAPRAPEQTAPPAPALPGDLGVSRAITRPACDGRYIVLVGAATDPLDYPARVQDLLDAHPGSEYLRAVDTCPSLRARDSAGNEIYGVYHGPFATREQACRNRNAMGADSYVKVLDNVTASDVIIQC